MQEDKEFLDQQISHHFQGKMRGTKVVVRNGSRLNTGDLHKMALDTCKAVIVLSDPEIPPNTVRVLFPSVIGESRRNVATKTISVLYAASLTVNPP